MSNARPFRRRIMHNYVKSRGVKAINITERFWALLGYRIQRSRNKFKNVISWRLIKREE